MAYFGERDQLRAVNRFFPACQPGWRELSLVRYLGWHRPVPASASGAATISSCRGRKTSRERFACGCGRRISCSSGCLGGHQTLADSGRADLVLMRFHPSALDWSSWSNPAAVGGQRSCGCSYSECCGGFDSRAGPRSCLLGFAARCCDFS